MPAYKVIDRFDPSRTAIVIAANKMQARRKMEEDRLIVELIDGVDLVQALSVHRYRVVGEETLKFKPLRLELDAAAGPA